MSHMKGLNSLHFLYSFGSFHKQESVVDTSLLSGLSDLLPLSRLILLDCTELRAVMDLRGNKGNESK